MSIPLNRDVLIYMLDKLPVPDLLRFLKSNLALMQDLLPVFTRKINAYELEFEPTEAASMTHRQLEQTFKIREEQRTHYNAMPFPLTYLSLDDEIVKFMHLGHMPRLGNRVLYKPATFSYWWTAYFETNDLARDQDVLLTPEMKSLARTDNDKMDAFDFIERLLNVHSQRILSPPTVVPEVILFAIAQESQELSSIINRESSRSYRS